MPFEVRNLCSEQVLFWLYLLFSFSIFIMFQVISFWLNVISSNLRYPMYLGRLNSEHENLFTKVF